MQKTSTAQQLRRHVSTFTPQAVVGLIMAIGILVACGDVEVSSPPDLSLSPGGQAGLEKARTLGCGACHGFSGEGVDGLGPAFQSLFGSTVPLDDGSAIIADAEYLRRSIAEPQAEVVAGYSLPMPPYDLAEEDMTALLSLFEELK